MIINATSAGMSGKPELGIDLEQALPGAFIYDLVYTPEMTGLLKQAALLDLPYIGGLDMLISQARPSFKLFFGQTPPAGLDPAPLLKEALSA